MAYTQGKLASTKPAIKNERRLEREFGNHLLEELLKPEHRKITSIFKRADPAAKHVPDYHKLVKSPITLLTIRKNCMNGHYGEEGALKAVVDHMLFNFRVVRKESDADYQISLDFEQQFNKLWNLKSDWKREMNQGQPVNAGQILARGVDSRVMCLRPTAPPNQTAAGAGLNNETPRVTQSNLPSTGAAPAVGTSLVSSIGSFGAGESSNVKTPSTDTIPEIIDDPMQILRGLGQGRGSSFHSIKPDGRVVHIFYHDFSHEEIAQYGEILAQGVHGMWLSKWDLNGKQSFYEPANPPSTSRVPSLYRSAALKIMELQPVDQDNFKLVLIVQGQEENLCSKVVIAQNASDAVGKMLNEAMNGYSVVFCGAILKTVSQKLFASRSVGSLGATPAFRKVTFEPERGSGHLRLHTRLHSATLHHAEGHLRCTGILC